MLRRADRAGELAFHLDRAGDSEGAFSALLAAADAAETIAPGAAFGHLERAFELWDSVGERSATVDRGHRLWQAADIATSTVGNERAVQLARAAFDCGPPPLGAAWGHERLGRYLWATGRLQESSVEFAQAAAHAQRRRREHRRRNGLRRSRASRADGGQLLDGRGMVREGLRPDPDTPTPTRWHGVWRDACWASSAATRATRPQRSSSAARPLPRQPSAQGRALATLYLCVALGDAGDYQAALSTALDAVAEGQLTGLDRGFGCYFDSLAAEALIRLGRWSEVAGVLARQPLADTLPVGLLRLARAKAMLAARRGETELALAQLAPAEALPIDGWHQTVRDASTADVHLALGNWDDAANAAEQGWAATGTTSALWAARFAMFGAVAEVERDSRPASPARAGRRRHHRGPPAATGRSCSIVRRRCLGRPATRHCRAPRPRSCQPDPTLRLGRRRLG